MVSRPAGRAAEDQPAIIIHSFNDDAERVDGPTLLEKGPTSKYLNH